MHGPPLHEVQNDPQKNLALQALEDYLEEVEAENRVRFKVGTRW